MIRTEPLVDGGSGPMGAKLSQNAIEFEDYLPKHEKVEFAHGESEKTISINLVNQKVPQIEGKAIGGNMEGDEMDMEEQEEIQDVMFKVKIEKPDPEVVKISKKNVCIVTITSSEQEAAEADEHSKMIEYFVRQKQPTWGDQFKNACILGPQIDEDNLIVEEVSLGEALFHFLTIGWKALFAFVPPIQWGGGWPAFIVALGFIGIITKIVGEVATILGCVLGLKEAITGITLVAVGTSLPDTFASMVAAASSEFADSAIGNITGSNSVNVFLGLGLPWVIAAIYQNRLDGRPYQVPAGDLAFSVLLFLITCIICFIILIGRRVVSFIFT